MKLFELFATLGLDTGEFDKGVEGAGEKGKGVADKIGSGLKKASDIAAKTSMAILGTAVALGGMGLKGAMELEATEAKYKTVFGDYVDQADAAIKKFQQLTPATTASARSMYSGIQDLLVPMGFLREEATGMTGDTMHLVGALTNFNSATKTSEDVSAAFASALTGEYSSLKSLGIQVDANTVKQKALEMGLGDANGEVDKAGMAQALLALAYEQSGDALAAYNTESLDTTTKIQLLKTKFQDMISVFGLKLLPTVSKVLDRLNSPKMQAAFEKLLGVFEKLIPPIMAVAEVVIDILASALEFLADNIDWLLPVVGSLIAILTVLNIVMNANPISLIIIGIAALVAGIILLIQNFDAVSAWFAGIGQWIYDNAIQPIIDFFVGLWNTVSGAATAAWNWIVGIWEAVSEWFNTNVIIPIVDFFAALWGGIQTAASDTWAWIVEAWTVVSTWFQENVTTPVSTAFAALWLAVSTLFSTLWAWIVGIWDGAKKWFNDTVITPISEAFTIFWEGIKQAAKDAWDAIVGFIQSAIDKFNEWLGISAENPNPYAPGDSSAPPFNWTSILPSATGMDFVPYDNMLRRLHRGEAVLTSLEADNWRSGRGQGSGVDLSALAQTVAAAIVTAMSGMQLNMDGETVGALVAPAVSIALGGALTMRRHTG